MKRLWLCGLPAAVLLGSTMPPAVLGYDPAVLVADCRWAGNCAALYDPVQAELDAERRRLRVEAEARARAEAAAVAAGLKILVSIPEQMLYVFRRGELVATSPVSTGKRGYGTPAGVFQILEKKVAHRSNLYANAPMPYMQRLTYGGVALHAGAVRGYPASHGCIRLPWAFARKLYGMTSWTTRVIVTRARPQSTEHALELAQQGNASAATASTPMARVSG